jgi:hypothetical protein
LRSPGRRRVDAPHRRLPPAVDEHQARRASHEFLACPLAATQPVNEKAASAEPERKQVGIFHHEAQADRLAG